MSETVERRVITESLMLNTVTAHCLYSPNAIFFVNLSVIAVPKNISILTLVLFFHLLSSLHKEEATARCCMAMLSFSDTLTLAWWVKF